MINNDELENRIGGNFHELKHRRISALGTAELPNAADDSLSNNDASFRLRQHGEDSRLQGEPGRVTNFLQDIESHAKKLHSMDMVISDFDPSGKDIMSI